MARPEEERRDRGRRRSAMVVKSAEDRKQESAATAAAAPRQAGHRRAFIGTSDGCAALRPHTHAIASASAVAAADRRRRDRAPTDGSVNVTVLPRREVHGAEERVGAHHRRRRTVDVDVPVGIVGVEERQVAVRRQAARTTTRLTPSSRNVARRRRRKTRHPRGRRRLFADEQSSRRIEAFRNSPSICHLTPGPSEASRATLARDRTRSSS